MKTPSHTRTSYGKLNKKQTEEIGTDKSPTKPLYLTKQKIERLKREKQEIEQLMPQKYAIDDRIKELQRQIQEEEITLKIMQEMDIINKDANLEDEKIKVHTKSKEELESQKKELEKELADVKPVQEKKEKFILGYIISVIAIILGIIFVCLKNYVLTGIAGVMLIAGLAMVFIKNSKQTKQIEDAKMEYERQRRDISSKIELIQNDISSKQSAIKAAADAKELKLSLAKEQLKAKYGKYGEINTSDITSSAIMQEQNHINDLKLNLNRTELNKKMIIDKSESLSNIQEQLDASTEYLGELLDYQDIITIAKDALNSAYTEMRESITPRFTQNLSNAVHDITKGKYKTVKVNENNNLLLETTTGTYVDAGLLSEGTIDAIYLSLRISSIDELTKENMPIILDETFAFFDKHRLASALEFLRQEYQNKQIIILTCTSREADILGIEPINL